MSRISYPSLEESQRRVRSSLPPPGGFCGTRETWERLKRATIPIDPAAIWLAQYPQAELLDMESRRSASRNLELDKVKRHIALGEIKYAPEALAWIAQTAAAGKDLLAQRFGVDKPTARLLAFWESWGLLVPHRIPPEWLEARRYNGTFPMERASFPDARDILIREWYDRAAFMSFVQYATLVRLPPETIRSTYDLCVAESS